MDEHFSWAQAKALLKSSSFIPFTLIWITHGIGGWGISFILPSVIYELGMSNTAIAQVMTMPPYTLVFVFLLSLAFLVQKKVINAFVAGLILETGQIVCYILLLTVKTPVAKYIFVMMATAAGQSFFPIMWPERIRAAKGTTGAGLAIGITNVSCYEARLTLGIVPAHGHCWSADLQSQVWAHIQGQLHCVSGAARRHCCRVAPDVVDRGAVAKDC